MYDCIFLSVYFYIRADTFSSAVFFGRMKWMSAWPVLEHLQRCQPTLPGICSFLLVWL